MTVQEFFKSDLSPAKAVEHIRNLVESNNTTLIGQLYDAGKTNFDRAKVASRFVNASSRSGNIFDTIIIDTDIGINVLETSDANIHNYEVVMFDKHALEPFICIFTSLSDAFTLLGKALENKK